MCDRLEKFELGDAIAIQCVTYGKAACHWSAVVLREKNSVEISTPAANREANLKRTDRAPCADAVVAIRTDSLLGKVLASSEGAATEADPPTRLADSRSRALWP